MIRSEMHLVELCVNRFNRIVSTAGMNEDGVTLLGSLQLNHKVYEEAVERVLATETIELLLDRDEEMSMGVIGNGISQEKEILAFLEESSGEHHEETTGEYHEETSGEHHEETTSEHHETSGSRHESGKEHNDEKGHH